MPLEHQDQGKQAGNKAGNGKSSTEYSPATVQASVDSFGFDVCRDSSVFHPSSSVEVDDNCQYQYTKTVRLQLAEADVRFPFPPGPKSCSRFVADCNGQPLLNEVRNIYIFSKEFEEATGSITWVSIGLIMMNHGQ